jgi:hypothetical protein
MELTLFEVIESKTEIRERAKALSELYASLRDAPEAIDCRTSQVMHLQSFVERSAKRMFDANWWDGLQRCIGDPEELLTARDLAAMRRDKSYWKKSQWNHLCCPKGTIYRCKLHPKEIALLEKYKLEVQSELNNIKMNLPLLKDEIQRLRAIGPLPKDIAERYRLTEDGLEKKKETDNENRSAKEVKQKRHGAIHRKTAR